MTKHEERPVAACGRVRHGSGRANVLGDCCRQKSKDGFARAARHLCLAGRHTLFFCQLRGAMNDELSSSIYVFFFAIALEGNALKVFFFLSPLLSFFYAQAARDDWRTIVIPTIHGFCFLFQTPLVLSSLKIYNCYFTTLSIMSKIL